VIETDDMKLAMKAGKLETAGKYDEGSGSNRALRCRRRSHSRHR
jgi:hypothetical protein